MQHTASTQPAPVCHPSPTPPAVLCWLIAASIITINASTAFETLSPLVHSAAYLHAGKLCGRRLLWVSCCVHRTLHSLCCWLLA